MGEATIGRAAKRSSLNAQRSSNEPPPSAKDQYIAFGAGGR